MKTSCPVSAGWLDQFAACVRNRDLHGGRALFAPDVRAFGTRAEQAEGLADLVQRQWARVWFNTQGFCFLDESVEELASDDGGLICVLALWKSEGLDAGGQAFARRGRCTIVLRRAESSLLGYVAVHTHFSKTPPDEL
jgi:ketosteroid isomerase-like protein